MNKDQTLSLVRTALKMGGAVLAAHGAANVANFINGEDVAGVIAAIVGIYMSHQTHKEDLTINSATTTTETK